MTDVPGAVYRTSDGRYVTTWQLDRLVERGTWRPCLRDDATGDRLVEGADGTLLSLVEVPVDGLPDWVEVRVDGDRVRAVDARRTRPPTALEGSRPGTRP